MPVAAPADPWGDAVTAAALLAVDPRGLGGIRLRAAAGPLRERWLDLALSLHPARSPRRRVAASVDPARLVGGLDLAATLAAGRPLIETGILAAAHGGVLTVAMAERLGATATVLIAGALDRGAVRLEREGLSADLPARFALIALDEGIGEDEALAPALADRIAFDIGLDGIAAMPPGGASVSAVDVARAKLTLAGVELPDRMAEALCSLAAGPVSLRRAILLGRAARAAAALRGARAVEPADAVLALRLVLGAQALAELARREPEPPHPTPPETETDSGPGSEQESGPGETPEALRDRILDAAAAALPPHLLDAATGAAARRRGAGGKAGSALKTGRRGAAIGAGAARPYPGARPDLLATLRAAAPWQRIRPALPGGAPGLRIRPDDFRYVRRRERRGSTAIFVVDASGSAAVARLAEAKGAVELLLAECYVRRDEVALVAFRAAGAEILLGPTRSLVRAKRSLAMLPGGGGTPLADGIRTAGALALSVERQGRDAICVFLTDGRANIGLGGRQGREAAMADAEAAARRFRGAGLRGVVIDTATRPQPPLGRLARDLGADYVALPRGDSRRISQELDARMKG